MANGFSGFYIGDSGLRHSQNALNTTANNLANVDTVGYVREQVRFADTNYNTRNNATSRTNIQQTGLGVSIGDVAHARDIFLDKSYRQEAGRKNFYETCYEVTSYIEDLFQELSGEEFKESISEFWVAAQEFAKDPGDSTNENLLLRKGELLLSRANSLYKELQNYQCNLNEQIEDEVKRMNEIGNRIYEVNLLIQKVEASGVETAMTLRDERDALIDELAEMSKIEVTEDSTGLVYLDIEGVRFVDENMCYNIGLQEARGTGFYTPYWPQLSDVNSEKYYEVYDTSSDISTEMNNDIGSVKALLYARGNSYGRYFDMSEENYHKIEDCAVMETQAEIDYLLRNVMKTMNDALCPNASANDVYKLEDGNSITAYDADGKAYTINSSTLVLDVNNATVGTDGKLPPNEIFTRIGVDRYAEVTDDEGNTYYIYNEEEPDNNSTWYAIGSVEISPDLSKTVTKMPVYTQNGAVDYGLGDRVIEIWNQTNLYLSPSDTEPVTIESYYDKILGRLGIQGNIYYTAQESLTNTASSIDNQRKQITGVNSDEELTKMIQYQSAYNAASRFITVISQMTEVIVGLV